MRMRSVLKVARRGAAASGTSDIEPAGEVEGGGRWCITMG